jgi:hypothetical protein
MKRRTLYLTLLSLTMLLLAACTARITTTINADGTGDVTIEFGFTEFEASVLSDFLGMEPSAICDEAFAEFDYMEEVATSVETRGEETWCMATMAFASLTELEDLYYELDAYVDRLEIDEETLTYNLELDLTSMSADDLEQISAISEDLPLVEWRLIAPGSVIGSNADNVQGRTLTWVLDLGTYEDIQATTKIGGASIVPWLVGFGGCIGLAIMVGLIVWVGYTSMKKEQQ